MTSISPDLAQLALERISDPEYPATPIGCCDWGWYSRGIAEPGQPFLIGYPSASPGEGPAMYYCASCEASCREQGVELLPAPQVAGATR
jgi:hypothetical protein